VFTARYGLNLNTIQVKSRLQCANEQTSGVFKFIRPMEFSIQNASIVTPTKINLLYQILQKADNTNFRCIRLRVSEWKRMATRTLCTYKTLSHTHNVYRHTKHSTKRTVCRNTEHSATCTLCAETQNSRPHAHYVDIQNTRPHARCVQKHKTFGHTHIVYRQPPQTPPLMLQRDDANDQMDNNRTFVV